MKLLVISHACATPINQDFFASIQQHTGWELTLIVPTNWKDDFGAVRKLERWPEFSGNLVGLPVMLSGNIPLHVYRGRLARVFQEQKPDAIYVHHEPYGVATAQAFIANQGSTRVPIGFFTWQNINKKYPFPISKTEQMVYRRSSFAVAGSKSAVDVLREKGYTGKAAIIAAGVDTDLYKPIPDNPLRQKLLGDSGAELLIGFVGRVAKEKGLSTFVNALGDLSDLSWKVVILGKGDFEQEMMEQATQLGIGERIDMLGYVPHTEAPKYLAAFDLLVLPSETQSNWKEQFGRVLIEAAACGTPVIGSDSGEIPNVIKSTGGGLVFAEGNKSDFADALRRFHGDTELRTQLSAAGLETARREYTQQRLAERFAEVIEGVV